ncbi:MAG: AAA domain-containing protein [Bacteroidota bacterium]
MQQILKTYLNRLTNISATNRSLLLRKIIKEQFIDVHDFDFCQNKPSFSIIQNLIAGKQKIKISQVADARDEGANILSRRIRKLSRYEKLLFEEHGSKDLYVGWPFIRGKFTDGTHVRCPLLYFPVEIVLEGAHWVLHQREDVNITLNKTFLLAYGYFNQVKISEELLERVFEDFDTDSMVFRTSLYQLFKESPVELNFNQDNFIDQLVPFKDYTKAEFENEQKEGVLKLFPEAVLGIFPQSGSYLVPDYEYIIENDSFSDLQTFFETKIPEEIPGDRYGFLSRVKEEETYTPLKVDAYQENAIKAVKKGNSLVIQGPPGTGKSQVICNLISDYIARGKKVLLVCQKKAALDVVYERFEELEMSDFIGLVHDFKNDRKELYQKIDKQIKSIDLYRSNINSLDALQLERKFLQHSRKIDQLTEEFEEFKTALFDENECGISAKELYLTSNIKNKTRDIKQEYKFFNFKNINETYSRMKHYASYAEKLRHDEYVLLDRKSFAENTIASLRRMQEHLAEINEMHAEVAKATKEITGSEIALEDCINILDKLEVIKRLFRILRAQDVYSYFAQLMKVKTTEEDLRWLLDHEELIKDSFSNEGIETTLGPTELGHFQKSLQTAILARKNIIKFVAWIFTKDRDRVKAVMQANGLPVNRKNLSRLIQRIDNRLNLGHNITLLNEKNWVERYDGPLEREPIIKWIQSIKQGLNAKILFSSLRNFNEYFPVQQLSLDDLINKIDDLFTSINKIPEHWNRWELYFTKSQLRKLTTDDDWFAQFSKTLERDFDSLCDFDKLSVDMEPYELDVVNRVMDELDVRKPDDILEIIDNSLRLQWIEHIETKYPVLRSVSSLKFKQLEQELRDNVTEKLDISHKILMFRAKEQTFADVEYNRLKNMVTYRELGHQVTKQRRIWPLRKLITHHAEELFHLLPCWMASPETVSAVFPMEELFDLVIFDEASQCFTEKGIPAMYRGKQLVVSGDNKQLRPNDLYQVRIEEELDDIALDVDSLLELSSQYLMEVQLRGHYRSRKPELIEFSNQHFYGNHLRMLPDKDLVNNNEVAIEYIKTDGIWDKQANRVEAEEVVKLIVGLIKDYPEKSIGIVTFNAKQQDLILDLIDLNIIEAGISLPSSLIVKNIENIQGDEKDFIIFSTAYAPDKNGKLMMQFGSLNIANGENRLNVAVTRAREKIFLVTSVWPQQLKVSGTRNEGPKLLKSYMEYAKMVSDSIYQLKPVALDTNSTEWYLKNRIEKYLVEEEHCDAREELPFADITIAQDNEYLGLISTDDDSYYQSPSVKDAHVYTPLTLLEKHWRYKSVYSRNFWLNEDAFNEEVRVYVNQVKGTNS